MTSFEEIRKVCEQEGISMRDVDRILLNTESFDEFCERARGENITVSHYATVDGPAVRRVDGPEQLVYVNERGYEVEISL